MKRVFFYIIVLMLIGCGKNEEDCIVKKGYTTCRCSTEMEPVCGCNGETYRNHCFAECAGVVSYEKGACK